MSQPAARLVAVAGLVLVLVVAQFALLIVGGAAAEREARSAAEQSVAYLADVSQERVLNTASAVDQVVRNTTRVLLLTQPDTPEIVSALRSGLQNVTVADALSVTYPNGDFVELRRSETQFGGYKAYMVDSRDRTVASRFEVEYDAELDEVSSRASSLAFGTTWTQSYRGALESFEMVWTGPSYDPVSDQDVVRASLAVRDRSNRVVLVVAANLAIAPLQRSLATLPTGSDGEISVVAADGTVIAAPANYVRGDAAAPGGRLMTVERVLEEQGPDWVVRVQASAAGLNGGVGRLRSTLEGVIGGLMILTVALGYLLATMLRPMMTMRHGAERDSLTGLYNRRHADAAAESLLRFVDGTEGSAAFAMVDLDDFKSLNDDLGHVAGDRALAAVGARVDEQTRAGDLAARWGGDEFLLVLLLAPEDDAAEVVERVRAAAADVLAELFPDRPELGATAGYALTDGVGDDVGVLIASADRALVRGKAVAKGYTYALAPPP